MMNRPETDRCVILANGQFPESERVLGTLRQAAYICCCDGAVEKLASTGLEPSVIVGDGDSISPELKERYKDIFIKIDEQETNDLTKATLHCVKQGFREITYIGATGLREDHTVANIFLLPYYLVQYGIEPVMLTDHGVFKACRGKRTFKAAPGQTVSLYNYNCERMKSEGLKWPVYPFQQLWQGTLNKTVGSEFTIDADGVYLVFLAY